MKHPELKKAKEKAAAEKVKANTGESSKAAAAASAFTGMIDHQDVTDKDEEIGTTTTEHARALAAVSRIIPTTTEHARALAAISQTRTGPPPSTIEQVHAITLDAATRIRNARNARMAAASQTDYTSDEGTIQPESNETRSVRSSQSSVSVDFNDQNIASVLDRVEDWQTVTSAAVFEPSPAVLALASSAAALAFAFVGSGCLTKQ